MLNYRPSRRLGVTIKGEDSLEIHRMLVEEGKKMSFEGTPEAPKRTKANDPLPGFDDVVVSAELRQAAEEELDAFIQNPVKPVDQMDTKLQTGDTVSALQIKLRTVIREANMASEELGINTLFLTLGILEWSEEAGNPTCKAPLLFVPVRLERQSNGVVKLLHDGSDVGSNHPLEAKLAKLNLKLPEFDEEKSLLDYFAEVESTVRSRQDWIVHRNEAFLDFFSYEKYVMQQDLSGDAWPEGQKPWTHPDLIAMLGAGYREVNSPISDRDFIDDARPVAACHEVFDADSSQSLVMVRANEGHSIIVEGPPGTGKSQTIANIIAESVAEGKRVLFVSSKRAALDVVKRRLDEAGLGPMCLVMHDKLTNRREFYSELKRTANLSLTVRSEEERVARLTELRAELNSHSSAVNEPIEPFGVTPFLAMCRLAALTKETAEDRESRIPFEGLQHWPESAFRQKLPILAALMARIREIGVPREHAFWKCEIEFVDPGRRLDLQEDLSSCINAITEATETFEIACRAFSLNLPCTSVNAGMLLSCAERAAQAPPHEGVATNSGIWIADEPEIRRVIANLRDRAEIVTRRKDQVLPTAWSADLSTATLAYERHAAQLLRALSGEFRRGQAALATLITGAAPTDPLGQRDLLRDLTRVQALEREIQTADAKMRSLFGVQWRGIESSPATLEGLLEWVLTLEASVSAGKLPSGLLDFLAGGSDAGEAVRLAKLAREKVDHAVGKFKAAATLLQFSDFDEQKGDLAAMGTRACQWLEGLPNLSSYIAFNEARRKAIAEGLGETVAIADRWPLAADRLSANLERNYYEGIVRVAMQQHPSLRNFERERHERAIKEFQDLDAFKLVYNRARVRLAHLGKLPSFDKALGNLQLLKVQCELSRKQKPIRWIMSRAGEAIQRIKPVFMMSPLSVAIHLPPELPPFDLVVFDEASQIKPEDALSSIIRARQTIVVGDTKQLPPTSFFDRIDDDDDPEPNEPEDLAQARELAKLESILSLMSAVTVGSARRPDLRWHYRSLHESLIAPSNETFYGSRLIVFPSARSLDGSTRVGLVFHHLPDAVYEGGSRHRINMREAETIAAAVVAHMEEHPDQSLMVAAMNKPQADLIWDLVSKAEASRPDLFSSFRQRHPYEQFDVKNLENVQGDERDVVFVSMTYGRDESGIIRQTFGPLLKDGGDRRLNVLFTRSKLRCEVFSNLTWQDIRAESNQPGLLALKTYLRAAETGRMDVPIPGGDIAESPFEEEVARRLRERGYQVDCQVGSIGYRIDLGVVDPDQPGNYLLGIECDGATYHSARSARDRDKLRQYVLEQRGWRLHRIWSRDWWQDPDAELQRVIRALEGDEKAEIIPPPIQVVMQEAEKPLEPSRAIPAYQMAPRQIARSEAELYAYLQQVVFFEGPIGSELLTLRLKSALTGVVPAGSQRRILERVVNQALASGAVRLVGDAYCASPDQEQKIRDWSGLPAAERKLARLTDTEIANSICLAVESAFGVEPKDAVRAAIKTLGFKKLSDEGLSRGMRVIDNLLACGSIVEKDGALRLAGTNKSD